MGEEKKITSNFLCCCRDVIGEEMLAKTSTKKIGGLGLTVEIDESMFGKRKVVILLSFVIFLYNYL